MPTESWDEARENRGDEVAHMKKMIPFYSYADERVAVMTDRKLCSLLRDELSKSKGLLHEAVDWLYKAKLEDMKLERIRDDFDTLLDEVEVKSNRWDEHIPHEFLEKIMEYDWSLFQKAWALQSDLAGLIKALHKASDQNSAKTTEGARINIDVVHEKIDDITRMFKEREAAFDITHLSFRDSFRRIKDRIRKSI